jgi:hypothetical protein
MANRLIVAILTSIVLIITMIIINITSSYFAIDKNTFIIVFLLYWRIADYMDDVRIFMDEEERSKK